MGSASCADAWGYCCLRLWPGVAGGLENAPNHVWGVAERMFGCDLENQRGGVSSPIESFVINSHKWNSRR